MEKGEFSEVTIFNRGGFLFENNIREQCRDKSLKTNFYSTFEDLKEDLSIEKKFIIAHITDKDWQDLLENVKNESMCIRVSSDGILGLNSYRPPYKTKEGSFVFHLVVNPNNLKGDHLQEIIALANDNSKYNSIRYLFERLAFIYSSTLSILCQAYLSLSFRQQKNPEGEILKAIEKMGWIDFFKTESGQKLAVYGGGKENQFSDSKDWINYLGNLKKADLLINLANELLTREENELPMKITRFINEIYDDTWQNIEDHNKVIAEAYLEIASRLESLI